MAKPVPAVRILPMSPNEKSFRGRTLTDVQEGFFLSELPAPPRSGRYCYPTSGLSAEPGTVVLFQFMGKIIASAVFERHERFDQPEGGYRGALWFDSHSIRTFEPVGAAEMIAIWPDFPGFGQAKHELDGAAYADFERRLTNVRSPSICK